MEAKEIKQENLSNLVLRKIVEEKIKSINPNDLRTLIEILQILDLGKVKSLKKIREIEIIRDAGLIGAVSTDPKPANISPNSDNYTFNIPRLVLPDNLIEFMKYASWIEYAMHGRN